MTENKAQFQFTSLEAVENAVSNQLTKFLDTLTNNFQPKQPPTYITRADLAAKLKVDQSTIYNWTVKGILKPYQLGSKKIYYKLEEVEEAMTAV